MFLKIYLGNSSSFEANGGGGGGGGGVYSPANSNAVL